MRQAMRLAGTKDHDDRRCPVTIRRAYLARRTQAAILRPAGNHQHPIGPAELKQGARYEPGIKIVVTTS